jgi:hypothetical protein
MTNKTKTALVIMGMMVIVLGLLLVLSNTYSENIISTSLHLMLGFASDSKQYEPVIAFKEKYPNYIILKQSDYPRGDRYANIVYAYTNSSLYRTEVLSVQGDPANPSFSQKCIDEDNENFGTRSAKLPYFSKQNVDDFRCANYSIDSESLKRLHDTKKILEQSKFPIKEITYNYEKQFLEIRLFTLPKDNYEEKINAILLENNVDATIEYQRYGIGTFS